MNCIKDIYSFLNEIIGENNSNNKKTFEFLEKLYKKLI